MKRRVGLAVLVMGFSGLVAEILLLRELLIVFSGNELSIGVILANWLALEAIGSLLAGRVGDRRMRGIGAFTGASVLFSLSLPVAVLLARSLKHIIGVSIGESIGLLPTFTSSLTILLPVSLLHGAQFTLSCRLYDLYSDRDGSSAGRVYVYETVGTIVGGLVCTYLLIPHLNTLQAFAGVAVLNFVTCTLLLAPRWSAGAAQKATLVGLSALVVCTGYTMVAGHVSDLHERSVQAQWKALNVVHYENSRYGNIAIAENQGQYITFLDGLPAIIVPIPDMPSVEEFAHLSLLAHPEPARILILSGGAGGLIHEILKHPSIVAVEYAELDPLLLRLLRDYPTPLTESELNDERVEVVHIDGRRLLETTQRRYDLIFVGITDPSSLQANRFFTREFFASAAERLNEGGILVLGLPGSLTLLNEELRDLNSCILHTLSSIFPHIRAVPGDGRNIFLASASREVSRLDSTEIVRRLTERSITTNTVVPWYIENKLHEGWQGWFSQFIEGGTRRANLDFRPLGLFYSLSHWNAIHAPAFGRLYRQVERVNLGTMILIIGLFLLVSLRLRSKKAGLLASIIPFSIATTGFAGMVFSLAVIFAFQIVYGYVFSWIGLLVAAYMAGAACGATLMTLLVGRARNRALLYVKAERAMIGYSVALLAALYAVNASPGSQGAYGLLRALFLILQFTGGLLVGAQFPLANELCLVGKASPGRIAGVLYASDLLGGFLGGTAGAVVLLPVLGLAGTCITVGLLKLASHIVVATQPQ